MSMYILAMAVVIIGLLEVIGFLFALCYFKKKLDLLCQERTKFNSGVLETISPFLDRVNKRDDIYKNLIQNSTKTIKVISEQYEMMKDSFTLICEAYQQQEKAYTILGDHYSKLLTAWSKIEDRYSDCYELIKQMNDRLEKFEKLYWNPDLDSDMLGDILLTNCKYNTGGECQNEDCPALNMYCTVNDPKECKYSDISGYPKGVTENEENQTSMEKVEGVAKMEPVRKDEAMADISRNHQGSLV